MYTPRVERLYSVVDAYTYLRMIEDTALSFRFPDITRENGAAHIEAPLLRRAIQRDIARREKRARYRVACTAIKDISRPTDSATVDVPPTSRVFPPLPSSPPSVTSRATLSLVVRSARSRCAIMSHDRGGELATRRRSRGRIRSRRDGGRAPDVGIRRRRSRRVGFLSGVAARERVSVADPLDGGRRCKPGELSHRAGTDPFENFY